MPDPTDPGTAWPAGLPAVQLRIARPTDRLDELVQFYHELLGLKLIGSFEGHDGYDGVMLGLPGREYHLEFTRHSAGSPCPAPTRDNLIVFYLEDEQAIRDLTRRLRDHGHEPVAPENPYWLDRGTTFEDPDGWRIVLVHGTGF